MPGVVFREKRTKLGGCLEYKVYSKTREGQPGRLLKGAETIAYVGDVGGVHYSNDIYYLSPESYIISCKEIDDEGEHSCFVAEIEVGLDGSWKIIKKLDEVPFFVSPPCGECFIPARRKTQ